MTAHKTFQWQFFYIFFNFIINEDFIGLIFYEMLLLKYLSSASRKFLFQPQEIEFS